MLKASRLSSIRRTWSSRAPSPIATISGIMDLIGLGAVGGDIAFHQRRARPPCRACSSERVNIAEGAAPLAIWTICSGCVSAAPSATSITTPSVIIALFSATIGCRRYRARAVAPAAWRRRPPAPRAACGCRSPFSRPPISDRFGANTPSTSTSRRAPSIACSFRAAAARFSAAASGAAASGSTSRISTRRSVYFQSSIRRCGRPARS